MSAKVLGVGIIGLGRAAAQMLPSLVAHPCVRVVAAADPDPAARDRFTGDYDAPAYAGAAELCADAAVEAVYVATPHALHAPNAILAAEHGKHVLVEKPMALTLEDARAMTAAAQRADVALVVGPTHGSDPPITDIAAIVQSGTAGRVRTIVNLVYGDFLYRPRRPEELDSSRGGGIIYNQVPHQLEIVRAIAGDISTVRAVTGNWDPARPADGALAAFLTCQNGAVAQLTYSGYDRFDSDELHGWVAEMGETTAPHHGRARRALHAHATPAAEAQAKAASGFAGRGAWTAPETPVHHPHFGFLLVSCERADLRATPGGVLVYDDEGVHERAVSHGNAYPDKTAAVAELYAAAVHGTPPLHDGTWGTATVAAMLALIASSRSGREIVIDTMSPAMAG